LLLLDSHNLSCEYGPIVQLAMNSLNPVFLHLVSMILKLIEQ
jgi:hypothetical protein